MLATPQIPYPGNVDEASACGVGLLSAWRTALVERKAFPITVVERAFADAAANATTSASATLRQSIRIVLGMLPSFMVVSP